MKPVKTLSLDFLAIDDLLLALRAFWLAKASRKDCRREDLYAAKLVKIFYDKLSRRHLNMLETGKKTIKVKFDSVDAILMVEVLQKVSSSTPRNNILAELGSYCPPQFITVEYETD